MDVPGPWLSPWFFAGWSWAVSHVWSSPTFGDFNETQAVEGGFLLTPISPPRASSGEAALTSLSSKASAWLLQAPGAAMLSVRGC